ncbi:hypothetical protein K432DRAFT_184134 [Lepidopterella palustris CBS 459.81]|uniref:Uncharacterized protein n=1 Tax=Lepidopterella palustris CBS 459.81 TaxID=1314670 RepID=A0A8E2JA40_9PEZI|nr:hypothetical protein K432DRAFT_184134 [Lepidopterella palustris CBS 459.81]
MKLCSTQLRSLRGNKGTTLESRSLRGNKCTAFKPRSTPGITQSLASNEEHEHQQVPFAPC